MAIGWNGSVGKNQMSTAEAARAIRTCGPGLRGAVLLGAVLLACPPLHARAPASSPAAASPSEETISYQVRKGDTLYGLAERYLHRLGDYQAVQRLNRVSRATALPPGTMLRIPTRLLRSEPLSARILSFRGDCRVTQAGGPVAASKSLPVPPGAVIETGTDSFLTLELSNGSRISLPSRSRIRVQAMRRFLLTNELDFDFLVEQGRVETGVTPLGKQGGRYRIRTPIAVSAVRGTTFRVGYEGRDAPSLTEVLEGSVAVGTSAAPATPVDAGFGAGVSASGAIRTEQLLPPPSPLRPGRVQVDPLVELAVAASEAARSYRFQIAQDAGFVEIVSEAVTAQPVARFEGIGNGQFFVRATAIAASSGLEGLPVVYTMRRALTGLAAQAGADAAGGYRFSWSGEGAGERIYHFQLRPDAAGALPLVDEPGLRGGGLRLSDLPPGAYRWRVGVRQFEGGESSENWLAEQKLLVAPPEPAPAR